MARFGSPTVTLKSLPPTGAYPAAVRAFCTSLYSESKKLCLVFCRLATASS